jgi:hypothetical protein
MANDIQIQRTVLNKDKYRKVIDTSFNTFTQPVQEEAQNTVEEFFRLYEELYYVIDVQGEDNSHEYLARRSSELADFSKSTEEIQPLLDEISQLREQLLQANQQILALETAIN